MVLGPIAFEAFGDSHEVHEADVLEETLGVVAARRVWVGLDIAAPPLLRPGAEPMSAVVPSGEAGDSLD